MLNPNPRARFTFAEILQYAWIREHGVVPRKPIALLVQSLVKQYAVMSKLKKLDVCIVAETFSVDEVGVLQRRFAAMGRDGDGAISFDELTEIDIFDAADVGRDGLIDYGTFLAASLSLHLIEQEERRFAAFQYLDCDGSGLITTDEVLAVCKEFTMEGVRVDFAAGVDYPMFVSHHRSGWLARRPRTLRGFTRIPNRLLPRTPRDMWHSGEE